MGSVPYFRGSKAFWVRGGGGVSVNVVLGLGLGGQGEVPLG